MVKFDDLLVSWVSYFNYDMVIILINVYHFHMIIHVKSIFHINVQVESHEEPCDV
jgi:hypothetical protein